MDKKLKNENATRSPDVGTADDDERYEVLDETKKVLVDLEQVEGNVKDSEGEVVSRKTLEQLDTKRNTVLGVHQGRPAHVLNMLEVT